MPSKRKIDPGFLLLLLPLLIYLPGLGGYIYPVDSAFSDLAVSHDPYTYFLQQTIRSIGQIPLWSPTILGGTPFAANPLAGLWYLPGWLALVFPLPLGLNLTVLAHLLWGEAGMYLFLRRMNVRAPAAWMGAVAFGAMPKLAVHFAAGHLTLIYAVVWTPWILWAETRRWEGSVGGSGRILPGLLIGVSFLADPRWAVYTGLAWLVYSLWLRLARPAWLSGLQGKIFTETRDMTIQGLVGAAVAAPLLLPLMQYARLSTRTTMTAADRLSFSLPPARLFGLFFPDIGGYAEWIFYPGAMILCLALFGVFAPGIRRRCGIWYGLFLGMVIWSLGNALPGAEILANLPGLDWMRVPSRGLFLACFALIVAAVQTVDVFLGDNLENDLESRLDPILYLTGLLGFVLFVVGGIWAVTGTLTIKFAWGAVALVTVFVWILARRRGWIGAHLWMAGALILLLLDCSGASLFNFHLRSATDVQSEGEEVARYLAAQPGIFRIYSPSYSLPQQTSTRWGLELADGVDPLQLAKYAQYMVQASGIPSMGYSVTLPAFHGENIHTANQFFVPNPMLLGRLNVRYLVSEFDLKAPGLALRARFGDTRIYENHQSMPRAWVQPVNEPDGEPWIPVEIETWTPNRVAVRAEGKGLLVLSELDYPGWIVRIDNQPARIVKVDGLLRGVTLEAGTHQVEFLFYPLLVYVGLGLAAMMWGVWLWLMTTRKRENHA